MLKKKYPKRKRARPAAVAKRRGRASNIKDGTAGFTYREYEGEMVAYVDGNIDVEDGDWMNRQHKALGLRLKRPTKRGKP